MHALSYRLHRTLLRLSNGQPLAIAQLLVPFMEMILLLQGATLQRHACRAAHAQGSMVLGAGGVEPKARARESQTQTDIEG